MVALKSLVLGFSFLVRVEEGGGDMESGIATQGLSWFH